jgi:tetratricopeptide (TPR) repeat protein
MFRGLLFLSLSVMLLMLPPAASSQVLTADREYLLGMEAGNKGDFTGALQHLRQAVILDPKMARAHAAIGDIVDMSCQREAKACELAIEVCKEVLELDATHESALKNVAYALYWRNRLAESEDYYRRNLALRADDPDSLCAVAAIGFSCAWREVALAKAGQGLPLRTPLIDSSVCREVRAANLASIDEGIAFAGRALRTANRSSELAGYLRSLYHLRAQLQCGDRRAYREEMHTARVWDRVRKAYRKRKGDERILRKCPPAPPPE